MQKGHSLQFNCISCQEPVRFSIFELENQAPLSCANCTKKYTFNDPTLIKQMKKFEALCRQICDSEEILGQASIGVDCGEHHVKIPYKLLLTRLNSCLDLKIGDHPISIVFRIEPLQDIPVTRLEF